ncbi:thioredoxin-like domain-containing protein [Myroides sp. DW712]|uniref:thioredoxin-like domain-containing protein n=1 Tax=Myroides sp. DW712 TaxID=3389800 RepID=UPI00397B4D8E
MIKNLVLGTAVLLTASVFAQDSLHFKGNIKGIEHDAQVWLNAGKEQREIEVTNGKFDMRIPLEGPEHVYLYVKQGNDFRYTAFYLGKEDVTIEGDIADFPMNIQAKNSQHDALRYQDYLETKDLQEQIDELEEEAYELMEEGEDKDRLYEIYMGVPSGKITVLEAQVKAKEFDFIKKHINTDYGRSKLMFTTGDFTSEQFQTLAALVEPKYKNTKEVQYLQHLADYPALEVGDGYYDFKALDLNQQEVSFSSLFKGKYVLLDFSTLHCSYCQREAPLTAEIAEQLKAKMDHITYYVDEDAEGVQAYFELKGKKGQVLWNREGRFHPIQAQYRVSTTPSYVLFDPKGKVVANWIGAQQNFQEILSQLIKK